MFQTKSRYPFTFQFYLSLLDQCTEKVWHYTVAAIIIYAKMYVVIVIGTK